jgi:hypothetical protein
MSSEQPSDLWLNIQEPHDEILEKIFKKTNAKRAKLLFDCLVDIAKVVKDDRETNRKLRKIFKETAILVEKFAKNRHLAASAKLQSRFDEIVNLIKTSTDLSKTAQTHKKFENFISKFNKF